MTVIVNVALLVRFLASIDRAFGCLDVMFGKNEYLGWDPLN